MALISMRYVNVVKSKGRTYYYYRRGGKQLAELPGAPGSDPFLKAYDAVHTAYAARKPKGPTVEIILPGSFREMAVDYLASPEFAEAKAGTRGVYRRYVEMACRVIGDDNRRDVTMKHIVKIRDGLKKTPAKANNLVKMIKVVYGWGIPRGLVAHNPANFRDTSVKRMKLGERLPWPEPMLARFMKDCPTELVWVMIGALYTGQRIGDLLKMSWADIEGDAIRVVQEKTGKELLIPLHSELKALLKVVPRRSTRIFTTTTGLVWKYGNYSQLFLAEKKRQGVHGYVFHGLRKNAVIRLLRAGCSIKETGSITGQSDEMVMYYARKMDQETLAVVAMEKLEVWGRSHLSVVNASAGRE